MNGPEVRESWGQPRRVAHNDELHEVGLWKVGVLLYVVVTWIIGHALIIKALWDKF